MAHRRSVDLTHALAAAAGALLAVAVLARAADLRDALLGLTLVAVVVPATWIDLDRRLIPNRITAAGALAAVAIGAATAPERLPAQLLAGLAAGGFLLVPALVRPDGMGMGDVKLAAVLGLLLGPSVAVALPVALVAATLAGLVLAARAGARPATASARRPADGPPPRRLAVADAPDNAPARRPADEPAPRRLAAARAVTLPLGPFLAFGGLVGWFAGETLLAAWLG